VPLVFPEREVENKKNVVGLGASFWLSREYRNTTKIPLGPQWIFTWNFLKLHHFYINNPTGPELTKMKKKQPAVGELWKSPVAS